VYVPLYDPFKGMSGLTITLLNSIQLGLAVQKYEMSVPHG